VAAQWVADARAFRLLEVAMVARTLHSAALALVSSLLTVATLRAQSAAPTPLAPNTPVQRTIAGGGADNFTVSLSKGQVLDATAMQNGVDVVVSVYGPDGRVIDRVDSPNGTKGPEHVWLVSPADGNYRIEVAPLESISSAGSYTMTLRPLAMASATVQQVLARDQQLGQALGDQDVTALRGLIAPNVTYIGVNGLRLDAAGLLAARQGGARFHADDSGVQVQTFGDAAVVSGHVTIPDSARGIALDGEWTRTWVKQNGEWKLASMQITGERAPIRSATVDAAALDAYAGKYTVVSDQNSTAPADSVTLVHQGNSLVYTGSDGVHIPFYAEAPGVFYSNDMRGRLIVGPGTNGQGSELLLVPYTSNGRVAVLKKTP
jgi:hypothetical protein